MTSGPIKCKVAGQKRSRTDSESDPVDFQFRGKTCSHWALRTPRRRRRLSEVREILQPFGSVAFLGIRNRSILAKKFTIFFWPNFDVKKEQISNTKRQHGQTDAENPYKTAIIARHRPELRHQKRQNECRISLKTKQHQDRTSRVFPNARRPEKDRRKPHQDNTHSETTKGTNLWTPYNDRMQTRHVGTSQ